MKSSESVNSASVTCDIIIPTFDNDRTLGHCLASLLRNTAEPFRLILVNNGTRPVEAPKDPRIFVINTGKNLGWIGGINAGLSWTRQNDPAKFVCFLNDDIQILDHDYGWLTKMLNCFELNEKIAAVGPVSNAVMGLQSSQHIGFPPNIETTRLSGMCFLVLRDVLEKTGPLDESLPGGDDLDISIRLRNAGYKLCISRRTFMLHHYGQTGKRVHGAYWDSREHTEEINKALIRKHGFTSWFNTVSDRLPGDGGYDFITPEEKLCLDAISPYLSGVALDLGCGGKKIHERAVGVDIRPRGGLGVGANSNIGSVADVVCDVSQLDKFPDNSVDFILARHLIEHIIDPIQALKEWKRVLKPQGKLLIVVPDYRFHEAISCDPSHCHGFTPDSLCSLLDLVGDFKLQKTSRVSPGYVFGVEVKKNGRVEVSEVSRESEPGLCGLAHSGGTL